MSGFGFSGLILGCLASASLGDSPRREQPGGTDLACGLQQHDSRIQRRREQCAELVTSGGDCPDKWRRFFRDAGCDQRRAILPAETTLSFMSLRAARGNCRQQSSRMAGAANSFNKGEI